MLKDFRESFATDLRNPDFQRELIAVAYEEEGPDGILNGPNQKDASNTLPLAIPERKLKTNEWEKVVVSVRPVLA